MQVVIIDAETSRELWFGEDCAKHCKIAPSTWRSYATQGRTPERVATILKKVPLWDAEEVKAWHAQRPGSSTQRANHHTPSANA
ncbi:hypothetical protein [Corynebacterium sp. HS2168-gen11]|uniref:hypothetical protein n=1 Tax=Corynebacterium sp. HS2168-gen11 TaxID=2974027 RepID=UPI00216B4B2F|nr:hypothetical protein [Corynebacterium sp. HS2168-gen11]MCS4535427.1 hypothetical protein [Corynebacterium sp. HS2168-gen11]